MYLRSRPAATSQVSKADSSPSDSPKDVTRTLLKGTAVTASGVEVPLDVERRKSAKAEDTNNGIDRPLQLLCIAGMVLPLVWAVATQKGPTVGEQLTEWATVSWGQFTDGKINLNFQIAVAALFIERLCYTWVHTFSASFVKFSKTAVGKRMGKKPLDVVLSIFWINKCIQLGTFVLWYFYVIGFVSPFAAGFSWSSRTRLQWVLLTQGLLAGQGLNIAIYRAIGKSGVYYGYRLGEEVPWVTGFPFSVMSHPQYSGVCLSVIGINAFVATSTHLAAGWFNLTAVQILLYVYMGLVEDYM